eukprot:scaffold47144_cov41-Phaeocystis_antarctica.AAC.1
MVEAGGISGLALQAAGSSSRGGGGAPRGPAGLLLRLPRRPEPPGTPRGGAGAELGRCSGGGAQ